MRALRLGARRRGATDRGFTLIELLVVVVIIGILIAIAIPVYLNYQKGAQDKGAESDLHNSVSILQQCDNDYGSFTSWAQPQPTTLPGGAVFLACSNEIPTTMSSSTVVTYFTSGGTNPDSYILTMSATAGSGKVYCFSSAAGGPIVAITTPVTAYRTTC